MGTIGGLLLILGAIFAFRGEMHRAAIPYFVGDLVWMYLAYNQGDIQGTIIIIIGTLLGVGAFIKMQTGRMRKSLKN